MMWARTTTLVIGLAAAIACSRETPTSPIAARPESRVVARVNGSPITEGEIRRAVLRLKGRAASDAATRLRALDALIFERAVRYAARKTEVTVSEEAVDATLLAMRRGYTPDVFDATLFAARLSQTELREVVRDRLLGDELLRRQGLDKIEITEAEVEDHWKSLPKEKAPERIRLAQIVVRTEDLAKRIHGELTAKGVDKAKRFVELAKRHSLGPERATGGKLGWFARDEGPKVFGAAFAQKVGDVGDVVASDHGYHIFMVEERAAAKERTLAEAREKLVAELRDKKLRQKEESWRKTVLAEVQIDRDLKAVETVQ